MKKAVIITSIILGVLCLAIAAFMIVNVPFTNYYKGQYFAATNKDVKAIEAFENADGYKDSEEILNEYEYQHAKSLIKAQSYDEAIDILMEIPEYKDSAALINSVKYDQAIGFFEAGELSEAAGMLFDLGDYKDSSEILSNITQGMIGRIAAADSYACIVNDDNTVSIIGNPSNANISQSDIKTVEGWTDIIAVEANKENIIGLKSDGTVVGVGIVNVDVYDFFINGASFTTYTSYAEADIHNYNDYSFNSLNGIYTYESEFLIYGIDDLEDVKYINSFSNDYIAGIRNDGSVFGTGYGKTMVDLNLNLIGASAIAPSELYAIILLDDGTIAFNTPEFTQEDEIDPVEKARKATEWSDIAFIDSGSLFSIGLKNDGTVLAVGINTSGQCDVDKWQNITAIAAGGSHTVGLKSDGTVVAVGYNGAGQCDVDTWENIVAIAASDNLTVGLKADGEIVCTENMVID